MDPKIIIESFLNAFDFGTILESITKYRKRQWELDLRKIIKYMIAGRGYINLTPPQTSQLLLENDNHVQIFDLRNLNIYSKNHIRGSLSKPIDDLLKGVYEGNYSSLTDSHIILVCDTGQLSKVAAAIMAEEGFEHVYSIKGGMRRWNRWMKFSTNRVIKKIPACCIQIS